MVREAFAGRMRYLEAGSGWPVVLLHAFPLSADLWRPQLEQVPDGWRYLAPDLPGFGPSPTAPSDGGPTTVDDLASGVRGFLDALEIERAAIGGLSMGGYVTLALFRAAPERFSRIILADTKSGADTEEGRAGRRKMLDLVRTKGPSAVADDMLPKLLGDTTRRERPELVAHVRRMIESNQAAGIAGAIEAMMGRPDSTPMLPRINIPALVVVGEEDRVTPPSESESIHRQLTRAQLVTIPGAGHLSALEAPDHFSRILADFLAANI